MKPSRVFARIFAPNSLRWLGVLGLGLALHGCGGSESIWGTYQEPTRPNDLPEIANAAELELLWQQKLGAGAERGYAILAPAYDADGLYASSRDGRVVRLSPEDGRVIWERDLGADIFSGVGVGDSRVVVTLDDGTVVALHAQSGQDAWRVGLAQQLSAIPRVGSGAVLVRTATGVVLALDAETGEEKWLLEREIPDLTVHGDSIPTIARGVVFTGLANGVVVANDLRTGREYWEADFSVTSGRNEIEKLTDSDAAPLVADGVVYVAIYQNKVIALNIEDASTKWEADISSRLPMALGRGGLLIVVSELGEIHALDTETGLTIWKQPGFRGHGMSRPLVLGQRVVIGDAAGNLYSIDLVSGEVMQKQKVFAASVIALTHGSEDRTQFVTLSAKGSLQALKLRSF